MQGQRFAGGPYISAVRRPDIEVTAVTLQSDNYSGGQDRWAVGEARALLLAAAGGKRTDA